MKINWKDFFIAVWPRVAALVVATGCTYLRQREVPIDNYQTAELVNLVTMLGLYALGHRALTRASGNPTDAARLSPRRPDTEA